MLFTHDTEVALTGAAALVNTEQVDRQQVDRQQVDRQQVDPQVGVDLLATPADLAAFVRLWGWTGDRRGDAAELAAVRALRPRLRRFWQVDVDGAAALANAMLAEAGALPQLVRHDGWDYHLHATPWHAPLADRMLVEAAMAVTDVIRQGELGRLRTCAAQGCEDVLVDVSRNRSRRFCGTTCANRTNVAAFRARRQAPRTAERAPHHG